MKLGKATKNGARARADGRRPLLVYLQPGVIKDLKKAALDDDRNVYEITEEAVKNWLMDRLRRNVGQTSTIRPAKRTERKHAANRT